MNRKDIETMVGEELACAVAEHIMGWAVFRGDVCCQPVFEDANGKTYTYNATSFDQFNPDESIDAAWMVVEKMAESWRFRLTHDYKRDLPYRAAFCKWGECAFRNYDNIAPPAICRAALLAVMEFDE